MKKVLLLVLVFAMVFAMSFSVPVLAWHCPACGGERWDDGNSQYFDCVAYDTCWEWYQSQQRIERLNITIDGETIDIPEEYGAVIIYNNRTMVPVRFVSEFLNFAVDWSEADQLVVFMDAAHAIAFQIGSSVLLTLITGERIIMDAPAMIYDNRSYIPVRFFAEAIGIEVDWDEDTRTVHLSR